MTSIRFERQVTEERPYYCMEISGHAGYAAAGRDIVCAGISTVVQALAGIVQQYAADDSVLEYGGVSYRDGMIRCIDAAPAVNMEDTVAAWFDLTWSGLRLLADTYPDYVQVLTADEEETSESVPLCGAALQMYADPLGEAEPQVLAEAAPAANGAEAAALTGEQAASAGSAAAASATAEAPKEPELRPAQLRLAIRSGVMKPPKPEEVTQYGVQPQTETEGSEAGQGSGPENPAPDAPDPAQAESAARAGRFADLIGGEYAAEFSTAVDMAVEQALRQLRPGSAGPEMNALLAALGRKYGMAPQDVAGLTAAVNGKDDAYFEKLAKESGMSIEQARRMDAAVTEASRLRDRNRQLEQAAFEQQLARQRQEIRAGWARQAEAMRERYPNFDFAAVRQEPAFADLMARGVPLEAAYRATHFDELLDAHTAATAQAVERGVTERIASRNARPGENGVHPGGAVTVKSDVSSLSRSDREEIERRVMRGEKIRF